jgi:hypothetical protein
MLAISMAPLVKQLAPDAQFVGHSRKPLARPKPQHYLFFERRRKCTLRLIRHEPSLEAMSLN